MSDRPTPSDERRAPYSALRAWEPQRDEAARARALSRLQLHIEQAPPEPATHPSRTRLRVRLPHVRPPQRWLAAVIALLAAAGAGGAVAAALLRTEHTNRLRVFTPAGKLSPEFQIGARGRGYCWESSLASTARNAYRCFQGNLIHDPCFAATPHATTVVCFLDPWHAVTLLRMTRRLPKPGPLLKGPPLPWAIVTTDGRHCVFMTGATALVANQRANYGCTDGTYLIGSPDTNQPLWTIRSDRRLSLTQMHSPLSHFPAVGIKQTIG